MLVAMHDAFRVQVLGFGFRVYGLRFRSVRLMLVAMHDALSGAPDSTPRTRKQSASRRQDKSVTWRQDQSVT